MRIRTGCSPASRSRSPIFENAQQASFAILNDYKTPRLAAGHASPFALRIVDTQNIFAAQGVPAAEAVRLRDAGENPVRIRSRLEEVAARTQGYMIPRDLYYLRARARTKGDRSVGLVSAALGSALDIKPVLHCNQGETGPVAKIRGFEPAVEKLFDFTVQRIRAGLLTPTLCLSYGGALDGMRALPGYARLRAACAEHGVEMLESVMSLTGMVNVGKGALVVGFAAEDARFVA
uniref:DegV family protein n=1 Tax=Coralloluteibacterium stylophorae TaxID=1776034 RepID=A0A8J8AYP5_9GAMM